MPNNPNPPALTRDYTQRYRSGRGENRLDARERPVSSAIADSPTRREGGRAWKEERRKMSEGERKIGDLEAAERLPSDPARREA